MTEERTKKENKNNEKVKDKKKTLSGGYSNYSLLSMANFDDASRSLFTSSNKKNKK